MLADVPCASNFDIDEIVRKTETYSGSDLKELCRAAAMVPVREVLRSRERRAWVQKARENSKAGLPTDSNLGMSVRPLKNSDFFQVDTAVPLPRPEPDTLD